MKNLTLANREKIATLIGREVALSEQGSIYSFEDFSELHEQEFRLLQIGGVLAISYIRYLLWEQARLDNVVSYYS